MWQRGAVCIGCSMRIASILFTDSVPGPASLHRALPLVPSPASKAQAALPPTPPPPLHLSPEDAPPHFHPLCLQDLTALRSLVQRHVKHTDSAVGRSILGDWEAQSKNFVKVGVVGGGVGWGRSAGCRACHGSSLACWCWWWSWGVTVPSLPCSPARLLASPSFSLLLLSSSSPSLHLPSLATAPTTAPLHPGVASRVPPSHRRGSQAEVGSGG